MSVLREWIHLAERFFDVMTARRLSPREQDEVAGLIANQREADAFWDQPREDQRHGLASARYVRSTHPDRTDLARAALLHDVGKRHAGLGIVGRSLAGAARTLGIETSGRLREYLLHGVRAADELAEAGADRLVVEFARHHHDSAPPPTIAPEDWSTLVAADHVHR